MVEETIKTIKETESEAEEILKAADVTCTSILEKAAVSANEIKEQAERKQKKRRKRRLAAAKEAGDYFYAEKALARVDEEIAAIEKRSAGKRKRSNPGGDCRIGLNEPKLNGKSGIKVKEG